MSNPSVQHNTDIMRKAGNDTFVSASAELRRATTELDSAVATLRMAWTGPGSNGFGQASVAYYDRQEKNQKVLDEIARGVTDSAVSYAANEDTLTSGASRISASLV